MGTNMEMRLVGYWQWQWQLASNDNLFIGPMSDGLIDEEFGLSLNIVNKKVLEEIRPFK